MAKRKANSVLDRMSEMTIEAEANRGGGGRGFWPGDHPGAWGDGETVVEELDCLITGVVFEEDMIKYKADDGTQKEDPGVYFTYQILDGSDNPDYDNKEVRGERFWIPLNVGTPKTEGQAMAREIAEGRFAGFVESLLGRPATSWGQDVGELQSFFEDIKNDEFPEARIKFETRAKLMTRTKKSATGEGSTTEESLRKYYGDYCVSVATDEDE